MQTLLSAPETLYPASPTERLCRRFAVASGSVTGREHRRLHRNNQDGLAFSANPRHLVAAVSDGCSAGRSSEVAARLSVSWLCAWLPRYVERAADLGDPERLAAVSRGLESFLGGLAEGLRPEAAALPATVQDLCLATVLAVMVDETHTAIFGAGDGLYSVNGRLHVLDAGPDNRPAYLGYRLLARRDVAWAGPPPALVLHELRPTCEVESLLLGTDGLLDLLDPEARPLRDGSAAGSPLQFEEDPRYGRNPSLVQKRLAQLGELNQRLSDDTTVIVLRRQEG
ncbi:MAG: protein phosphatase 2C domain-containing protein [Deltaproteobacteria bacterium]|nr:protein phosphatase 2C domain-containing protein [Deltaproteobacteria bacterium]